MLILTAIGKSGQSTLSRERRRSAAGKVADSSNFAGGNEARSQASCPLLPCSMPPRLGHLPVYGQTAVPRCRVLLPRLLCVEREERARGRRGKNHNRDAVLHLMPIDAGRNAFCRRRKCDENDAGLEARARRRLWRKCPHLCMLSP